MTQFDEFASSSTLKQILTSFNRLVLPLDLSNDRHFYTTFKESVKCWKASKLWELLDKRAAHLEYKGQKACTGLKVLIIGAGLCGLRMAIECSFLGCDVVVVEKRDKFSRNNVLHLWPFVIRDIKSLGGKIFYPRFCAGSIEHISIRRLQCILLKVALVLGVRFYEGVSFEGLLQPTAPKQGSEGSKWRASFSLPDHIVSQYEFDAVICADGQRNTLPGFRHVEFRGKLALAITANFVNRKTEAEEQVEEIAGISRIFNRQFFKDMLSETNIDLENIVYYKDDTHYFIMTATKRSLLERGVLKSDLDDITHLMARQNIDEISLMNYAADAADFATNGALPHLDFAVNQSGAADVAIFDFTSLFSAENSCRILQRNGVPLLMALVGDSLHEPFWPTGSGAARGFLSVFDATWMLQLYCNTEIDIRETLIKRESLYRLLAQTTVENLQKSIDDYTIDPKTRYANFEVAASTDLDKAMDLVDSDTSDIIRPYMIVKSSSVEKQRFNFNILMAWYKCQLEECYKLNLVTQPLPKLDNIFTSFRSGRVFDAILRRYCEEYSKTTEQIIKAGLWSSNNADKVFQFIFMNFKISFPENPTDFKNIVDYMENFKQKLAIMKPVVHSSQHSQCNDKKLDDDENSTANCKFPVKKTNQEAAPNGVGMVRTVRQKKYDHIRQENDVQLTFRHRIDKLSKKRVEDFERMLQDADVLGWTRKGFGVQKCKKKFRPCIRTRKLDPKEIEEMEVKLKKTAMGCLIAENHPPPSPSLSTLDTKIMAHKTSIIKERVHKGFSLPEKFQDFNRNLESLDKRLKRPNLTGAVNVSQLAELHGRSIVAAAKRKPPPPVPHKGILSSSWQDQAASAALNLCYFCSKKVYLTEKLTINNTLICHNNCLKCAYCGIILRLDTYRMERLQSLGDFDTSPQYFFCLQHSVLPLSEKLEKIRSSNRTVRRSLEFSACPSPLGSPAEVASNDSLSSKSTFLVHTDEEIDENLQLAHNMGLLSDYSDSANDSE